MAAKKAKAKATSKPARSPSMGGLVNQGIKIIKPTDIPMVSKRNQYGIGC